jgi:UDP-N-acetylglucosamine 2-epimerase (non-hydrolysing)
VPPPEAQRSADPVVALVAGTRPEVVKLAPVWHEARAAGGFATRWISTGQHGALERATCADLGVAPDLVLSPPDRDAGLPERTAHALAELAHAWRALAPRVVVVQGDTTTAFAAALAAFQAGVPVAHVEAGLRSFDPAHPFPEEAHRRMIAALTAVHLAHTEGAAANLIAEGMPRDAVLVTGNPGVDTQRRFPPLTKGTVLIADERADGRGPEGERTLLVTLHRRESWDAALAGMCDAVAELAAGDPSLRVVWPVHVQPRVARVVRARLADAPRVDLLPPLGYRDFQALLARADLVLTDSGGVQEEAPEYGVPVLVLRESTERPEAVAHGFARVIGRSPEAVVAAAREALAAGRVVPGGPNPFGDGRAAERIVLALARYLAGERPLLRKAEQLG